MGQRLMPFAEFYAHVTAACHGSKQRAQQDIVSTLQRNELKAYATEFRFPGRDHPEPHYLLLQSRWNVAQIPWENGCDPIQFRRPEQPLDEGADAIGVYVMQEDVERLWKIPPHVPSIPEIFQFIGSLLKKEADPDKEISGFNIDQATANSQQHYDNPRKLTPVSENDLKKFVHANASRDLTEAELKARTLEHFKGEGKTFTKQWWVSVWKTLPPEQRRTRGENARTLARRKSTDE